MSSTEIEAANASDAEEEQSSGTAILPSSRVDRILRKRFAGRRVSPNVPVYTTAALSFVFTEVIKAAKEETAAAKKKRISRETLIAAVRTHPELRKLFKAYVFSSGASLKYKAADLLTKADREAAQKKRGEIKKKKTPPSSAVPAVDEA